MGLYTQFKGHIVGRVLVLFTNNFYNAPSDSSLRNVHDYYMFTFPEHLKKQTSAIKPTMNTQQMLLLECALNAFTESTGLKATTGQKRGGARTPLVKLRLETLEFEFNVLMKNIDRRSALAAINSSQEADGKPILLITPRMTLNMAHECRLLGIQFIDMCGNAHVKTSHWFVYVAGRTAPLTKGLANLLPTTTGLHSASALRIAFLLLTEPKYVQAPFRGTADASGTALGSVSGLFADLKARGLIQDSKQMGRQLINKTHLQNEWATNYGSRLRPKLLLGRYRSNQPDWWQHIDPSDFQAQWGGEVAADALTNDLRPTSFTLYLRPEAAQTSLRKLTKTLRLQPDPNGNIELLESFWPQGDKNFCHPLLIYADLLNNLEPRCQHAAQQIYKEYLQ